MNASGCKDTLWFGVQLITSILFNVKTNNIYRISSYEMIELFYHSNDIMEIIHRNSLDCRISVGYSRKTLCCQTFRGGNILQIGGKFRLVNECKFKWIV